MLALSAVLLAFLLPVFYVLDGYIPTQYIFDPAKLQEISRSAISAHGNDTESILRQITRDLKLEYGDAVTDWSSEDWFFNNAGGAMGSMVILHASITEYLIFFGTALQTEGHSGVHLADDYFTILVGEQHVAAPGDLKPTIYAPGDQNHLRRGDSIQYSMPEACFALELAQGWIPAMLPFGQYPLPGQTLSAHTSLGFADTFSSTLDFGNLWKTIKLTILDMTKQVLRGKF